MANIHSVAVYLAASRAPSKEYEDAVRSVGAYLAQHDITLVFGGSAEGTMGILAEAQLSHGGRAIGVFPDSLPRRILYPGLTENVFVKNLAERKEQMLARADAVLALPGSFGTWDELFDALAIFKLRRMFPSRGGMEKKAGVLNVNGFFQPLMTFLRQAEETRFTPKACRGLLTCADTIEELFQLWESGK